MKARREKRRRWVERGKYAVQVEVDVVYSKDDPSEPCLEPKTVRKLERIAERAEKGDVKYLQKFGRVYQLMEN